MELITSNKISLKTIMKDNNENLREYCKKNNTYKYIRPIVHETINKILACNTLKLWYATFTCVSCKKSHKQPFTCKSRFCICCGKPASDKWYNGFISRRPQHLHTYHLFFTIPSELRKFFCLNRNCDNIALRLLTKTANQVLSKFFYNKYKCEVWGVSVIHTFGADCKRNPHIHLLITAWWFSIENSQRRISIKDKYLCYNQLQAMWKYQLLINCREYAKQNFSEKTFKKFNQLIDMLFLQRNQYGNKKSRFVRIDNKIHSFRIVLKYIWRYLKRPVIWESRIKYYDKDTVSFSYKDRETKEECKLSLPVNDFLIRIYRHIPDKHFKMVSYFWMFANRCKQKNIEKISKDKSYKENTYIVSKSFVERSLLCFGKDPRICSCWWFFTLVSLTSFSKLWNKKTIWFNSS